MAGRPSVQGEAKRWLARARSNLAGAELPNLPGRVLEDLGYDALPATEKSLQAVLVAHGHRPPRTHDLAELLSILAKRGLPGPPGGNHLANLNRYAVEARYPGTMEPATEEQHREALALASETVAWAEAQFAETPS
jgi:HEPN domain-containing protein